MMDSVDEFSISPTPDLSDVNIISYINQHTVSPKAPQNQPIQSSNARRHETSNPDIDFLTQKTNLSTTSSDSRSAAFRSSIWPRSHSSEAMHVSSLTMPSSAQITSPPGIANSALRELNPLDVHPSSKPISYLTSEPTVYHAQGHTQFAPVLEPSPTSTAQMKVSDLQSLALSTVQSTLPSSPQAIQPLHPVNRRLPPLPRLWPHQPNEPQRRAPYVPPLANIQPAKLDTDLTVNNSLASNTIISRLGGDHLDVQFPATIGRNRARLDQELTNDTFSSQATWNPRHLPHNIPFNIVNTAAPEITMSPASTIQSRPIATPVSRMHAKKTPAAKRIYTAPCVACMEDFLPSLLIPGPCACKYCKECIDHLFRSGCANLQSFPPSCHGKPFRINVFGDILAPDILARYKTVELEFSAKKPLYCALPTCSAFIKDGDIIQDGQYGICHACENCTCIKCKMLLSLHTFNPQMVCPDEPKATSAVRSLGESKAWATCPSCENMIEKVDGCDHISCHCGIEFCYACASLFDEFDECKCFPDGTSDEEMLSDEEDELEVWPQHRLMMDAFGRPRCTHSETEDMDGHICHGCLAQTQSREDGAIRLDIYRCLRCLAELCSDCLKSMQEM